MADEVEWCGDDRLGYLASRTLFPTGTALRLGEAYRLAHLPLVAPQHPDLIERQAGKFCDLGRHAAVHSLVIPVPFAALHASAAYRALDAELKASSFAGKLAWAIEAQRRNRLHATLCGSLAVAPAPPPVFSQEQRDRLQPMDVETIAAAGLTAVTLYLLGVMMHHLFDLPAPVAMLFLAVLAKLVGTRSSAAPGQSLQIPTMRTWLDARRRPSPLRGR